MWIHVEKDSVAYNSDHISRLYVEETGSGAAVKAEVGGKTHMIAYMESKAAGRILLNEIVNAKNSGAMTFTVGAKR